MSETLQHLVLVRHGEGEGDIRRSAWKRGETFVSMKKPEDEELTATGMEQSRQAGLWIAKHILDRYGLKHFDSYFVSMSLRSVQSAVAMGFKDVLWLGDERLDERNRGLTRGLRKEQHHQLFPESYHQMQTDPLHWRPRGGESIIDVTERWCSFYDDIKDGPSSAIVVGHRDQMWAAMQPLECLSDKDLLAVNTDAIHNAQIIYYTSRNPKTGDQAPALMWKYSVNPMQPEVSEGWQSLPHVIEQVERVAEV